MQTLDVIRFVFSLCFTLAGLFAIISSVLGVFRFKHALSRIHSAALIDTVGMFCMLSGLIIAEGFTNASLKMLIVIVFLWLTSPVTSHLIGRLEIVSDEDLDRYMRVEAREMINKEKEMN